MTRTRRWLAMVTALAVWVPAAQGVADRDALAASTSLHQEARSGRAGTAPIPWYTRFEAARRDAVAADRPMLLEFWAGWCEPCIYMDANVYSNPQVAEAMKRVVPVRVDLDAQGRLARTYNVESIPTLVFTDSHGNELFRYSGLLQVEPMVQLLRELPMDIKQINRLSQRIAAKKGDAEALSALGAELRRVSLYRASNTYFSRALDTPDARKRPATAAVLLAMGQNHLELKEPKEASKLLERCIREFPGTPAAAEAAALLQRR